jgi:hypothetical protein
MGRGHGYYSPAKVLFPWGMAAAIWQDHLSMIAVSIAVLQYPLYGIIIDRSAKKKIAVAGLLKLHIILATIVLKYSRFI